MEGFDDCGCYCVCRDCPLGAGIGRPRSIPGDTDYSAELTWCCDNKVAMVTVVENVAASSRNGQLFVARVTH